MRRIILFLVFVLVSVADTSAQNDPTLAAMIALYTETAEKEYKKQESAMLLQSTGHIWTKEEVEATTDLQREFNDYLDSFRSIICYAAQIYGFYHETAQLIDNMSGFVSQLEASPSNALAVVLSAKRNSIYSDLILNGVEIVNDIRSVCLSDNKMTEAERMEIVFGIRPKLKTFNHRLRLLTRAVKYTDFGDIWLEIDENARPHTADKTEIVAAAKRRWKQAGRKIKP